MTKLLETMETLPDGRVALRWKLEADGAGRVLRFANVVDGPAGAVANGWQAGLDRLAALLAGLAGGGDVRR